MRKTLGGDRLNTGKKNQIETQNYGRSTHDLSMIKRTTMSAGTIVPMMHSIGLPGDTWDIEVDLNAMTHPTVGPLLGKFKVLFEVFTADMRLYSKKLHNNRKGVGLEMNTAYFPVLEMLARAVDEGDVNVDSAQINPSCILNYLGMRGVGIPLTDGSLRKLNGMALLAYWDIYANYYANQQEKIGMVVHSEPVPLEENVAEIRIGNTQNNVTAQLDQAPSITLQTIGNGGRILLEVIGGGTGQPLNQVFIVTESGESLRLDTLGNVAQFDGNTYYIDFDFATWGALRIVNWRYATRTDVVTSRIGIESFSLSQLDEMRDFILETNANTQFNIFQAGLLPYNYLQNSMGSDFMVTMGSQEGLGLRTYSSDLYNNWLDKEWIEEVNTRSSIDTSTGEFSIDALIMAKKIYEILNDVVAGGNSYKDWIEAVWDHDAYMSPEIPIYKGGLVKELLFEEVVSNTATGTDAGSKPQGNLAGRGRMGQKHRGGRIHIKVDNPTLIMANVSIVPVIDYSQGNDWTMGLVTMDDLHKPGLDQIGYQPLITEQMAWWETHETVADVWTQRSAGYIPAWQNYMTETNKVYGNFANASEGFMVLTRRYTPLFTGQKPRLADLTTYIDPEKFNHIFAVTALDSQNFWMNVKIDATVRRKMSAKIQPRL